MLSIVDDSVPKTDTLFWSHVDPILAQKIPIPARAWEPVIVMPAPDPLTDQMINLSELELASLLWDRAPEYVQFITNGDLGSSLVRTMIRCVWIEQLFVHVVTSDPDFNINTAADVFRARAMVIYEYPRSECQLYVWAKQVAPGLYV